LDYHDPIPQDQTVRPLPLMVAPVPRLEVDLIDFVLVLLVAVGAILVIPTIAVVVYFLSHRQSGFDLKALNQNVTFLLPVQLVIYLVLVGFMAFIVSTRHNSSFKQLIHWNFPTGTRWLSALGGGAAMGLGSQVASAFLSRWIPKSVPFDQYFRDATSAYMLAGFGIFIAPLVEELFFRGFMYPAIGRWIGAVPSVMLTSAAFSLLHQAQLAHAWAPLLILFWVGVALTVVRARTNSVATCVLVHMGYNGALFGLMFYFTEGFRHLERAV
jgi:uncharacterized protein